jgi:hypothetical protein
LLRHQRSQRRDNDRKARWTFAAIDDSGQLEDEGFARACRQDGEDVETVERSVDELQLVRSNFIASEGASELRPQLRRPWVHFGVKLEE